jgi:outer membrane protein assembly factor BamB
MIRRLLASVLLFVLAGCYVYPGSPCHSAANVCGDLAVFFSRPGGQEFCLGVFILFERQSGPTYIAAVNMRTGKVAWRYQRGRVMSDSPPVIDGTTAYVWQDGRPCAIDCLTGKQRWYEKDEPRREEGSVSVGGKAVVFHGFDQRRKDWGLFAYDKGSGQPLWERVGLAGVCGHADGRIFALQRFSSSEVDDTCVVALIALNAETGETLWQTPTFVIDERGWTSGSNDRAVAIVGSPNIVRCFDSETGQPLWSKEIGHEHWWIYLALAGPRCYIHWPKPTDGHPWGQPWVLVCDLLTGEELREWRPVSGFTECLFRSGDGGPEAVLVDAFGEEPVKVVDAETGSLLREFSLIQEPADSNRHRGFYSFSIVGNTLFAGGHQQGRDNHPIPVLYQFDLRTGKVLWSLIGEAKPPR